MAIFGWLTMEQTETCVQAAERGKQASDAMGLLIQTIRSPEKSAGTIWAKNLGKTTLRVAVPAELRRVSKINSLAESGDQFRSH